MKSLSRVSLTRRAIALHCPVPVLLFPLVAVRGPVPDLFEAVLVGLGEVEEARALGAQRSFIDGMVGIALDVEDFACHACQRC